jgi:hypothetical protein
MIIELRMPKLACKMVLETFVAWNATEVEDVGIKHKATIVIMIGSKFFKLEE